jgi:putative transposase
MGNSYLQLYVHFVFAVKYRNALITKAIKERIHQYTTGIVQKDRHKMMAIHCMPDHTHMLIGMRPTKSISDIMEMTKANASKFINEQSLTKIKFEWQRGYGAFSVSPWQVDRICKYIHNQEEHHRKKTFRQEYIELLNEHEIEYEDKYLFEFFDDVNGDSE